MGFRFKKSIKIAPGVKLNLSKKGSSVTVGNKYARTTIGKNRKSVSASIPGTGISYMKQTSNRKKTPTTTSSSNSFTPPPNRPGPQMEWSTAFKIIKWAFFVLLGFILLMMVNDSPAVLIGVALIIGGMILTKLTKQGRTSFKRTWVVATSGWILALFLWISGIEPVEEIPPVADPNNEINSLISAPVQQEPPVEVKAEPVKPFIEPQPEKIQEEVPVASTDIEETEISEEPEPIAEPVVSEPIVEYEHYRNCKELNAVYPNGVPADHPAYDTARDRDKDGWACER